MSTTLKRLGRSRREARRQAARRKANRAIILEEKKRGCSICLRTDLPPEHLEFHHRDWAQKRRKVCHLVSYGTAGLRHELSLCRLLCKGCHARFHAGQNQPDYAARSPQLPEPDES